MHPDCINASNPYHVAVSTWPENKFLNASSIVSPHLEITEEDSMTTRKRSRHQSTPEEPHTPTSWRSSRRCISGTAAGDEQICSGNVSRTNLRSHRLSINNKNMGSSPFLLFHLISLTILWVLIRDVRWLPMGRS